MSSSSAFIAGTSYCADVFRKSTVFNRTRSKAACGDVLVKREARKNRNDGGAEGDDATSSAYEVSGRSIEYEQDAINGWWENPHPGRAGGP